MKILFRFLLISDFGGIILAFLGCITWQLNVFYRSARKNPSKFPCSHIYCVPLNINIRSLSGASGNAATQRIFLGWRDASGRDNVYKTRIETYIQFQCCVNFVFLWIPFKSTFFLTSPLVIVHYYRLSSKMCLWCHGDGVSHELRCATGYNLIRK